MNKKEKVTLSNIWEYIVGHYRYFWFYRKNPKLKSYVLRKHIIDQIELRLNSMNEECYITGNCVMCGCKTTHLQMANKKCNKPCYPRMLNKEEFRNILLFSNFNVYTKIDDEVWIIKDNMYLKLNNNKK